MSALAASVRPLALWEKQKGGMRLVALDAAAEAARLTPGQNLSDARALVPDLEVREIDRAYHRAGVCRFRRLAFQRQPDRCRA